MRALPVELERGRALGIQWVVSHPGNYIDDRADGLARSARAYGECLAAVPGEVGLLIEGTAGAGTALGSTFEELRALRDGLPAGAQARGGVCLATAQDRKSVGEGKRVDLGGRRIIKKKKSRRVDAV